MRAKSDCIQRIEAVFQHEFCSLRKFPVFCMFHHHHHYYHHHHHHYHLLHLLLLRFSRLLLDTQCQDSHLYLFSHWVIRVLAAVPSLSSIQKGLVPYLVAGQANSHIRAKLKEVYLEHLAAMSMS